MPNILLSEMAREGDSSFLSLQVMCGPAKQGMITVQGEYVLITKISQLIFVSLFAMLFLLPICRISCIDIQGL
jgi:hypothetical protein